MKNMLSKITFALFFATSICMAQPKITVKGTQFFKDDKPYSYVGTNYWYGSLLGSKKIGDRKRLLRELDLMKKNGIDNLRILVGAEGGTYDYTVTPALQYEQGKYNEDLLDGLDYLIAEMGKRQMYAVLYLNNNWEWSGGMSQYLEWNGYGKIPNPNIKPNTWPQFMSFVAQYHSCEPCIEGFRNHIKFILGRTNAYNNKKYTEDPAIMAWQIANEPRVLTVENEKAFTLWLNNVVDLIDSLDSNHLISTGSEGKAGSNDDLATFERTHANPKIDYLTMHIWPKNWGWYKAEDAQNTLPIAIEKANIYINEHIAIAKASNRPIVIEEFGLPRENESLLTTSSPDNRNVFYKSFFDRLVESHKNKEALQGVNFWGFGGEGKAVNETGKWNPGDTFTADPPQEPQGLNTVFSSDKSTLEMVKKYNSKLK
ncbi:cellulase family glycosylhydrolase [Flavobacterium sp. LS1R49]|uniref:mannan endo-1,4-beta-mannosidase n=1 Tax=Flavobacterium shii TaxID=2987687 RepID=A0A9X3C5V7_9FLAO|nr:cellulase family glycosylhydrolase [Flavobacterium shii]MCV9928287.1 cellulase family glycosylhydrolase [Flavobacterium shii]